MPKTKGSDAKTKGSKPPKPKKPKQNPKPKPKEKKTKQKQKQTQKVVVNLATSGGGGGGGERTVYIPHPIQHNQPAEQKAINLDTSVLQNRLEGLTNKLADIQGHFSTRKPIQEPFPTPIKSSTFQTPPRQNESLLEFQDETPLFKTETNRTPYIKVPKSLFQEEPKKRGRPVGSKNKPKEALDEPAKARPSKIPKAITKSVDFNIIGEDVEIV